MVWRRSRPSITAQEESVMALSRETLEQLRVDHTEDFTLADHDPGWLPPAAQDLSKGERKELMPTRCSRTT